MKTKTLFSILSLIIVMTSCNSGNSNSNNNNTNNSGFDEQKFEQDKRELEEKEAQLTPRVESKIQNLGYKEVGSVYFESFTDNNAKASCPVQKTTINVSSNGTVSSGSEDKTYLMKIYFKKYSDYEIVKVELWDEGNSTYQILE